MKTLFTCVLLIFLALAVTNASAQESKAVFKGTAENSTGLKFSDWDLTLLPNKPLALKQTVTVGNAHTFNFKAKKGQKLSVKIVSKEPSTAFVIYENWEDGGQIGESGEENKSWQGEIEKDGDYKIVLSADGKSAYTITVKVY